MWKTTLGRCIYKSDSGFQVHQNAWYRWLTTGNNVLQSLINRRNPEQFGLEYIAPLTHMVRSSPGDCCVLGLGGAGIPHALFPALTNWRMVAVELNQDVIDIAARYFKVDRITNLTTVHQNAQDFVRSTSENYQHMIIDVYNSNHYPVECSNDAFFSHCQALLNPGGILSINLINIHQEWQLFQRIRNLFNNNTLVVPIKNTSNTLVFAFNIEKSALSADFRLREQVANRRLVGTALKAEKSNSFLDKIQHIHGVKNIVWDPSWGCIGRV